MDGSNRISRREFMAGAAGAAAFTIVPGFVLGANPPSDKLNIASVGAGGIAQSNINNVSSQNIVALCDVDDKRAADVYHAYPNVPKYRDFRQMLDKEDKNIDAVIVAIPDHNHAVVAMAAMKRGKHVYVQKPLTKTVKEARTLTEAARQYKVVTQMGNQGHSGEGIRLAREWIQAGAVGNVMEVHCWTDRPIWPQGMDRPELKREETPPETLDWDQWLGPAPYRPYVGKGAYQPFTWRGWWDFGTGALGDMGCHIIDTPFWALDLKYPVAVEAISTPVNSESAPVASIVTYEFPARGNMPAVKLVWYDGKLRPTRPAELEDGRDLTDNGVLFIGDKGKMLFPHGASPRLIPDSKTREFARPEKSIKRIPGGEGGHEMDWVRACKEGGDAPSSNFDYAGPLTETVVMGNLAIRAQKRLTWDGENMKVLNIPEANQYVHYEYRQGWTL
jgi:predicted dehydrogenase